MSITEIINTFRDGQRIFNDEIFTRLDAIQHDQAILAYAGLALVGFLYGVIHAVGPGHGKVIVSSYILANENSLKRGLIVVALSSLLQALTAITVVLGFYYILDQTRAQAERLASLLEIGSFTLIGSLGLILFAQGLKSLARALSASHDGPHASAHDHCACPHGSDTTPLTNNSPVSLAAMIISIGIRPCSGGLLLLFFSCMAHLTLPGILATLAMSIGTATTTGALAYLAYRSKDIALKFVNKSERSLLLAHAGLRLVGGAVIVLMATIFITAQIAGKNAEATEPHPLYKSLH